MPALLALIPGKDWLYGGLIVALIIFGLHEHHKILAAGIAQQKAADDAAAAILEKKTAAQTAELQARATMAEQAYDKEQAELAAIRSAPIEPVRLCLDAHPSGGVVPQAGTAKPGTQSAGTTSSGVQQLPEGNHSGGSGAAGPDISKLLEALAVKADLVSAQLREAQSR